MLYYLNRLLLRKHSYDYLNEKDLSALMGTYEMPVPVDYSYDAVFKRGKEKAYSLIGLPINFGKGNILELGCYDGLTSFHLKEMGYKTTAIDIREDYFEKVAINAGVNFHKMDAENLTFKEGEFDFIFSFASMEHFPNPDIILDQCYSALKKGGHLYFVFGPLYYSPFGFHAYGSIPIPYCHLLFREQTLREYVSENNLPALNEYLNGWSFSDYRNLWQKYENKFKIIKNIETMDYKYLDMIKKYTNCFAKYKLGVENFLVSSVKILLRK